MKRQKIIKEGLKTAVSSIYKEDKIWSCYSNDKVDIGEELAKIVRTLNRAISLRKPLRAMSIGSSAEPQFRILETAFHGGLYLFDIDKKALSAVRERTKRQNINHVTIICDDFNGVFISPKETMVFLKNKLKGQKLDLITLHHSLYYSEKRNWPSIIKNLYKYILSTKGAIHIVLMTTESNDRRTTAWLYNYFVEKFFKTRNDQDISELSGKFKEDPFFKNAQILRKTKTVRFSVGDFGKFMSVIWMILLYPEVHRYTLDQKKEITEYVYKHFWLKKKPLTQLQDHMVIYKGIKFRGLI